MPQYVTVHIGPGYSPSVVLSPGDDVPAAVAAAAAGAVIYLQPGSYPVTDVIEPKAGQVIYSNGEAVIDGAVTLSSWSKDGANDRWYATATFSTRDSTMRDSTYSVCELSALPAGSATDPTKNLCWDREQVFVDGVRATRVGSVALGDAGSGWRFYGDRALNRVWVWTDPAGHTISMSSTPHAIDSNVDNVTLEGLVFQRFASQAQRGAVRIAGDGWLVKDCVVRDNHAVGLQVLTASDLHVTGCSFIDNGQMGVVDYAPQGSTGYSGNVFENSAFSGNNREDFYIADWEAGAFKTSSDRGGVVRDCTFSDDRGLALWVDYGSQWIFENNTIDGAWAQAIRIEVSKNCIVRNNVITGCGHDLGEHYRDSHVNWATVMDTCGISISESSYVECYGNSVDTDTLNGIIVNVRGRTDASASATDHVFVHGNTVVQRRAPIPTGDVGTSTFGTMIAGGMHLQSAPQLFAYYTAAESWSMPDVGGTAGSGETATRLVDIRGNTYRVGDLGTTRRFAWTSYHTGTAYSTLNPADATDIAV